MKLKSRQRYLETRCKVQLNIYSTYLSLMQFLCLFQLHPDMVYHWKKEPDTKHRGNLSSLHSLYLVVVKIYNCSSFNTLTVHCTISGTLSPYDRVGKLTKLLPTDLPTDPSVTLWPLVPMTCYSVSLEYC